MLFVQSVVNLGESADCREIGFHSVDVDKRYQVPTAQRAPIIAVFGSSLERTLAGARYVGSQVADHNCILLTGAGRVQPAEVNETRSVKDAAFLAAGGTRGFAPRIGVERDDNNQIYNPETDPDGHWIFLRPGYAHKRNYLEAHLCDAAIAFPGIQGTPTEVACCFALNRPVVLLGEWENYYPKEPGKRPQAMIKLRDQAESLMKMRGVERVNSPFNPSIEEALACLPYTVALCENCEIPNSPEAAGAVVDLALNLLGSARPGGSLPQISENDPRPEYESTRTRLREWLNQVDDKLQTTGRPNSPTNPPPSAAENPTSGLLPNRK